MSLKLVVLLLFVVYIYGNEYDLNITDSSLWQPVYNDIMRHSRSNVMNFMQYNVHNTRDDDCHVWSTSTTQVSIDEYYNKRMTSILVTLNGENHGYLYDVDDVYECALTLCEHMVLNAGVASKLDLVYPMYLMHSDGTGVDLTIEKHERQAHGVMHVMLDGMSFVWPGVRVGYEWKVAGATLRTISMEPRVIMVENALNDSDCDTIIAASTHLLRRSGERHYSDAYKNWRTSKSAAIPLEVGDGVRKRSWQIVRTSGSTYPEVSQLVQYDVEKRYRTHHDTYRSFSWKPQVRWDRWKRENPASTSDDDDVQLQRTMASVALASPMSASFDDSIRAALSSFTSASPIVDAMSLNVNVFPVVVRAWQESNGHPLTPMRRLVEPNRFATMFYYLNSANVDDDEWGLKGGETVFPNVNVETPDHIDRPGMPECSQGLRITPVKGNALLFYNIHQWSGAIDMLASHGGCPPIVGQKYGINSFVWNVDASHGHAQQHIYGS